MNVAPNTFLATTGTAANSVELGGLPASDYVSGTGSLNSRRIIVPAGQTASLLSPGVGSLSGTCTSNIPTVSFTPTVSNENYVATVTSYPGNVKIDTLNAIPAGVPVSEPNTGGPQTITYQSSYTDGTGNHVATAWTSGEFLFGTGCMFSAQGVSTQ